MLFSVFTIIIVINNIYSINLSYIEAEKNILEDVTISNA
jgi:hypothetical protein